MSVRKLADELEALEEKAGNEGWGGEFREAMFDEMLCWLQEPHKHPSIGLLLTHLISKAKEG